MELFSNNSDGTRLTPDQQRLWVAKARRSPARTPTEAPIPHAVARRLGPAACAEILRRYEEGETAQALAEEHGIARNAVLSLLRGNNVVVRRKSPTDTEKRRFVSDYESGATIAQIAKRTGYSHGTVWKLLRLKGVSMRSRGSVSNGSN